MPTASLLQEAFGIRSDNWVELCAFQCLKTQRICKIFPLSWGPKRSVPGLPHNYSWHQKHIQDTRATAGTAIEEEHITLAITCRESHKCTSILEG